jgi:hypothetical protein
MGHALFIDLNRPYIESSSQSATNKSWTVADVLLLSRAATRPTLDKICLIGMVVNDKRRTTFENTYSHTDLVRKRKRERLV